MYEIATRPLPGRRVCHVLNVAICNGGRHGDVGETRFRARGTKTVGGILRQGNLLSAAFGAAFIGIVSAVFAISFAAIIYTGPLAPFFDRGIALTLMGSVVLAVTGAFVLSYRGSIMQPQDVPAILLSGAVATLVGQQGLGGETLFATTAMLIAAASLATGVVGLLAGQLRLANLARYIPYPVLAGFLAATGLLLLLGGIGVATGLAPEPHNLALFFEPGVPIKWVPVCIAGAAMVAATRVFASTLTLPVALIAVTCVFFAIIAALGLSQEEARANGLLLGPFAEGGFLTTVNPDIVGDADWGAVLSQLPVILTIVAVSMLGTTLNASGLELELGRDLDINAELRGAGFGNALSALLGGLPGYHLLGETMLAARLGLVGPLAGISSAIGCLIVLVFGGGILSAMPTGLFATVIAFLGIDLLYTWLWSERRNLSGWDYAIVVLIPLIAVSVSFLSAIAVGLVVALCFFVIAYARLDVIRSATSIVVRRSYVERPDAELERLAEIGNRAQVIELSGYLFFASANVLRQKVADMIGPDVGWLVVDFNHVSGIDISTWHMLQRIAADCAQQEVQLLLSGTDVLETGKGGQLNAPHYKTLDLALEHIEDALLADAEKGSDTQPNPFEEVLALAPAAQFERYVTAVTVQAGEVVMARGSEGQDVYVLQSGQLQVELPNEAGTSAVVAQIRPGSVVGEMAYYTGSGRSANIVASTPATLLRLDMAQMGSLEQELPAVAAAFHKLIARHTAMRLQRTTNFLRNLGM